MRMQSRILGDYAEIGLTWGTVALVSLEDFDRINSFKWALHKGTQWRAVRYVGRACIYMHHEVLQVSGKELKLAAKEVDHGDGNSLNNKRDNLTIVSHQENMINSARHIQRVGFMLHKPSGLWFAYVNFPYHVVVSLGYYRTKEMAARVARMGQELQVRVSDPEEFKLRWKAIKPPKEW